MSDLVLANQSPLPETVQAGGQNAGLTSPQKAAIILSILEPNDAASLIGDFNEDTLLRFARAASSLRPMPPSILTVVVTEFLGALSKVTDVRGGVDQVRSVLAGFLDDAEIDRIVSQISDTDRRSIWERFGDAPPDQAAHFLQKEHPQTISYILAKLKPSRAAAFLEQIEVDTANTSILRLSRIPTLDPKVLSILEHKIEAGFMSALSHQSNKILPEEVIGNLMNNVSGDARDAFLATLAEQNDELHKKVIKVMFTFADIATRVRPNEVTLFTKEVDEEKLLIALKHASETGNPTFDFIFENLSKRLSERLREELDAMEAPVPKDAEAVQIELVDVIQRKSKSGEMSLLEIED
jgi:flagellar motor switch protein FliG